MGFTHGIILIYLSCAIHTISTANITVTVEKGTLLGQTAQTVTGNVTYYYFKGIPYAQPPVGSLRFKAPIDSESWTGVRNATAHGSICTQVNPFTKVFDGTEDCLYLNVYTSSLTSNKSVMVFFHGGGFVFGSGNDDNYGPDFLIDNDVVLVTSNYRLGPLGFLNLDIKEVSGNAGLKDQVAVLKWVQKNIQYFGGNPKNITIFGESAGSGSVAFHLVSPMSRGLFQRAIMISGVPSLDTFISYRTRDRAFVLGQSLGFETKNATLLLSFLSNVTYDKLINTTTNQSTILASEEKTNLFFKLTPFTPVVEIDCGQDRFLDKEVYDYLESGNVSDVDVLFGSSSQESLVMLQFYINESYIDNYHRYPEIFVPSKILISSPPDTILNLSSIIIDHYFGNNTVNVTNVGLFVKYASPAYLLYDIYRFFYRWPKNNTYCYKFSAESSRNYYSNIGIQYGLTGVSHLDILFNIFDPKSLGMTLTKNTTEYTIVNQTTTIMTNFAKTGNPSPVSSLTWPLFNNETKAFVNVTDTLTIGNAPDEEDITFWKSILEYAGIKF